jgi:hypothetical protein
MLVRGSLASKGQHIHKYGWRVKALSREVIATKYGYFQLFGIARTLVMKGLFFIFPS